MDLKELYREIRIPVVVIAFACAGELAFGKKLDKLVDTMSKQPAVTESIAAELHY